MDRSKIYQQINKIIDASHNVLLCLHPNPDEDSVGSCLAMYWYLKSIGKKVTIISGDSPVPNRFESLPGFNNITEQKFLDIDLSNIDLFIILDAGGLNQITNHGPVIFPPHLNTITIDHHASNPYYGRVNLIDSNSPATCQLVYSYLTYVKTNISKEIAINLFVGIYGDTGGFKYERTTSVTFDIASHLAKIHPDFSEIIFSIENSNTPGNILYKGLALKNIKTYLGGNLAISTVSQNDLTKYNITPQDTEKSEISNYVKSVKGWNIAVSIAEIDKNICNLSLRTRDPKAYDVSKIAELLGGGGHAVAAGARVCKSVEDTKRDLIKAVKTICPQFR